MKSLVKKVIFMVFNFLSNFIVQKKDFNKNTTIIILLKKPLGLGDIVMLSPFLKLIDDNFKRVYILSEYPQFLEFNHIKWEEVIQDDIVNKSLVISPTLALTHLKYILKAKYFMGYFFSNKFILNISNQTKKYNPKDEHYLQKVFIILDILNIKYDKNGFIYPSIKTQNIDITTQDYIVIAPYSNWKERQYKKENYIHLIKYLLNNHDKDIVLIGSLGEDEVNFNNDIINTIQNNRVLNFVGKTNILQMNSIIKEASFFIGNDSGPSNIAYIIAKKILVFFGCVDPIYRLPLNQKLLLNITSFTNQSSCKYFSCYDGYNKPLCKNSNKYSCLDIDLDFKILDRLCVE